MQLTKSFSTDEMECPCCQVCNMNPGFMAALQRLRDVWAKPIKVTSGYRCPKHNASVGGVQDSQHMHGRAADCEIAPNERYLFLKAAFGVGFKGIGVGGTFVHLDTRDGEPALWKYPLRD
jgi:uncharacterized protein YcbK (DUF882 family)